MNKKIMAVEIIKGEEGRKQISFGQASDEEISVLDYINLGRGAVLCMLDNLTEEKESKELTYEQTVEKLDIILDVLRENLIDTIREDFGLEPIE